MKLDNLLLTAFSSLKFHKLRTFLTMIGIIIGISSVVTILSVGDGFKEYVHNMSSEANANAITVSYEVDNMTTELEEPFSKNNMTAIERMKGVKEVKPSPGFMGFGSLALENGGFYNKTAPLMLDKVPDNKMPLECGRWMKKQDDDRSYIVLANSTAKELFGKAKDSIGKGITVNDEMFEVIGVTKEVEGTFNMINSSKSFVSSDNLKNIKGDYPVYSIDVVLKDGYNKKDEFNKIEKLLKSSNGQLKGKYKLQDPGDSIKVIDSIIGALTKFVAFITSISLVVGGIGVMNIMYVSVSERKREIGIRRAIGASPRSILLQFLIEAILVTLMGGIVGIILGYLVSKGAGLLLPFEPVLTMGTVVGATVISILEGVIFGVIPARNACRMDPIKAIYR